MSSDLGQYRAGEWVSVSAAGNTSVRQPHGICFLMKIEAQSSLITVNSYIKIRSWLTFLPIQYLLVFSKHDTEPSCNWGPQSPSLKVTCKQEPMASTQLKC